MRNILFIISLINFGYAIGQNIAHDDSTFFNSKRLKVFEKSNLYTSLEISDCRLSGSRQGVYTQLIYYSGNRSVATVYFEETIKYKSKKKMNCKCTYIRRKRIKKLVVKSER